MKISRKITKDILNNYGAIRTWKQVSKELKRRGVAGIGSKQCRRIGESAMKKIYLAIRGTL